MAQKFSPNGQEMSMISNYGWSGVFSVIVQREQEMENPEVMISQDELRDPDDMKKFNNHEAKSPSSTSDRRERVGRVYSRLPSTTQTTETYK